MEKYGKWRDAFTGVHPFLPIASRSSRFILRVLSWILGAKFMAWRLPGLAICLAALAIRGLLLVILDALHVPTSPVRRFLDLVVGRAALFFFGFITIEESAGSDVAAPQQKHDVVVCTLTSVVDVLFVAYRFSPAVYVMPANDGSIRSLGLLAACLEVLVKNDVLRSPSKRAAPVPSLSHLVAKCDGPVAVFPEGVTTNGQGVLTFSLNPTVWTHPRITICAPRHDATHAVGAAWTYVPAVVSRAAARLRVRLGSLSITPGGSRSPADQVRDALARTAGVPALSLGARDKADFVAAYHKQ